MDKLVSIIVPVYNGEKYLYDCLRSIKRQTLVNLEVIIIDDGSSDNSILIAEKMCKEDNRFKVIRTENQGVSQARNLGIKLAKGNYIGFVDSDDIIEDTMFEKLFSIFEECEDECIVACCTFDNQMNNTNKKRKNLKNKFKVFNNEEAIKEIFINDLIQGFVWNKLYDARILKEKIIFNTKIYSHEDLLFNFELLENNDIKLVFLDEVLYHYRINEEGCMFSNDFSYKRMSALDAYDIMLSSSKISESNLICIKAQYVLVNIILLSNILKTSNMKKNDKFYRLLSNVKKYRMEFFKSDINIKYKIGYVIILLSPKFFTIINK